MSISKELENAPLPVVSGHDPVLSGMVNLNELIRLSIRPFLLKGRNNNIVVRCANLPTISGNRENLQQVFDNLVRMIMLCPGNNKRFLHIQCEEQKLKYAGPTTSPNTYITFHTNLATDQNWKQLNQETLAECQAKLLASNALLSVHEISTTGCLFSISLQGKII
jgi:hypothetical protein